MPRSSRLEIGIFVGVLVAVGTVACSRSYRITSESMYPTLRKGDQVVVSQGLRQATDVRRGDLIVYRFPEDPSRRMLHRVVGLPGDRIEILEGRVVINGSALEQRSERVSSGYKVVTETNGEAEYEVAYADQCVGRGLPRVETSLAEAQFFVVGDNRCNSRDSRVFGPVAFEAIEGTVAHSNGSRGAR